MSGSKLNFKNRRLRRVYKSWSDGLSVRLSNILINADVWTREEAIQAVVSNKTSRFRNYGPKRHKELCDFLGLQKS